MTLYKSYLNIVIAVSIPTIVFMGILTSYMNSEFEEVNEILTETSEIAEQLNLDLEDYNRILDSVKKSLSPQP